MDAQFHQICSTTTLSDRFRKDLTRSGFTTIPGPEPGIELNHLATAYDELMASASGPNYKAASTTTRMSDVLNSKPAFAGVFTHPPLLAACVHFFGEQFKLSSFICRTLRANMPSQDLHADLRRDSDDAPLLGFILMIDQFHESNGATRFVPGSHRWSDLPSQRMSDVCATYPGEVLCYGTAGTMILFNGAIWHGHTANSTVRERRSIQGCFVRRSARAGFDFCEGLLPASRMRLNPLQRYLLTLED